MTAQRYKPLFERRRPGAYRISLCAIRYARGLVEVFHGDAGGQSRNKFVSTHFRYLGDALYREPLSPQHYRVAGFILGLRSEVNADHIHRHPADNRHFPAIDQHRRARRCRARITVAIAHRHHAETGIALADPVPP